jgi:cell wall-associated NlpC family hydrolase
MAALSIREIFAAARAAGFSPEQAVTWTSIALAESGGRPEALNTKNEHSKGLWQINVAADPTRRTKWGDLNDPVNNAEAAYAISNRGRDMRPWTTTHDHNKGTPQDYRHYLPQVEKLIGVRGDPRGVHGYHSALPPPLPGGAGSYDEIDAGRELDSTASSRDSAPSTTVLSGEDTDSDGLADAFEKLARTDPTKADTDRDGLDDGYEALQSHTDPVSVDTDGDHFLDPDELRAGTDAGRLPGIAGVVGSGLLAEHVKTIADSDADGLSDRTEGLVGTDAKSADTDRDRLADAVEAAMGTNPTDSDSDADGVADGLEVASGSDPLGTIGLSVGAAPPPAWTLENAAANAGGTDPAPVGHNFAAPNHHQWNPGSALETFLRTAQAQKGDSYDYSSTPAATDPNPDRFDCSSLTQWAARQAGVTLRRTAEEQYTWAKNHHHDIGVEEALRTPGALLFYFDGNPSRPLPAGKAHVAISLGNGRVFEARGTSYGVGEWSATARSRQFNYAAVIPGISDPASVAAYRAAHGENDPVGPAGAGTRMKEAGASTTDTDYDIESGQEIVSIERFRGAGDLDEDTDQDGLTDAFEALAGTAADRADTDRDGLSDGFEATTSHTDPTTADTDNDGALDHAELASGSDAGRLAGRAGVVGSGRFAEYVARGFADQDGDGVSDRVEGLLNLNAELKDSDGDKLPDGTELGVGTDPLVNDSDGDGLSDWLELQVGELGASALAGGLRSGLAGTAPHREQDDLPGTPSPENPAPLGGHNSTWFPDPT